MCDTPTSSSPAQEPQSNINTPFDPNFYTWSLFFRSILGKASDDEMKRYVHNRSLMNEERDCQKCEKWRDWLFQYSPSVNFLRENVAKLGGNLDSDTVVCKRCDTLSPTGIKQAAFNGDIGILLCANHIKDKSRMEDVLSHEMVHAYDYMRFKYDRKNLKHVACTEIRANLLSGECRFTQEFFAKGQYKFTKHFQECVRRRALLAVRMNPSCKDDDHAFKTVNEVWDSCFSDTRPFDEIYR